MYYILKKDRDEDREKDRDEEIERDKGSWEECICSIRGVFGRGENKINIWYNYEIIKEYFLSRDVIF